jgi:hypothetical protein
MGKGALSKYEKREERRAKRAEDKRMRRSMLSKIEQSLDAKDLSSLQGLTFYEKARFVLESSWILNAWYEKVLLLILIILSGWKVLNLFGFLL